MEDKQPILSAIIASAALTIVAVVFLTVFGELNPEFKAWLTQTFFHHWIGKSIISVLVFLVFIPIFYLLRLKQISTAVLVWILVAVANLSFGVLLAFFFFETYF